MDDPLRDKVGDFMAVAHNVLIPLLVDVPLWDVVSEESKALYGVLIPLLVDVPLWDINLLNYQFC